MAQAADPTRRAVSITIDDLPYQETGSVLCDPARVTALTDALIAMLAPLDTRAAVFVNEGKICEQHRAVLTPLVLNAWLDAGFDVGNHTFGHININTDGNTVDTYLADVDRGAPYSRAALEARGHELIFFRHPFLQTGATVETRDGIALGLAERGYRIAPVTLNSSDWLFAGLYRRAEAAGDEDLKRRIGEAFVAHTRAALAHDEALSRRLLGREPAQIYLMHANSLNRDWYPAIDALFRERGYRYVTLAEALEDPVYARPEIHVGPGGIGWLQRWALQDGLGEDWGPQPPQWILDASEAMASAGAD